MKIPLNWLSNYVVLPKDQSVLTDKLTMAGHMLDKVEKINGNTVIDLELRGNRADCYSILGIAREVSTLFQTPLKYPQTFTKYKKVKSTKGLTLKVDPKYVKRVMMVKILNVTICDSPKWLKESLAEYGIGSINNIVDLSNFVTIETGQPSHAFDLEKIGTDLEIKLAQKGNNMKTFVGDILTLTNDDLVWKTKHDILSVAGAIGSKNHSISDTTTNILLEAASYDRANIRRSIHRHNLFTDAGIRHEKELDPNLVEFGINRFLQLLLENKWGEVDKTIFDYYPNPSKPWKIPFNLDYLNTVSGFVIEKKIVKKILERLEFKIVSDTKNTLVVSCPTHRTDVKLEEDLIEEVLRIYGYDQIPTDVMSLEIPPDITPHYIPQEIDIKKHLISLGFNEVISLPFVKPEYQKLNYNLDTKKNSHVTLLNRPSPEVEFLRTTLMPNILELIKRIENERGVTAHLFEVGRTYHKRNNNYSEKRKVGIAYWSKKNSDFAIFKGYLEAFFTKLGLKSTTFAWTDHGTLTYENMYSISCKNKNIGFGGKINNIFYAEIDLDALLPFSTAPEVTLWPKYPPQIEDITVVLPEKTEVGSVITSIQKTNNLIEKVELKEIYEDSYTFRIWYHHPNKTLTNSEVDSLRSSIVAMLQKEYSTKIK